MVVGLIASPYSTWFPLSFDPGNIELIAVFGLILLLFNLGLEFDQDAFFGNAKALLLAGGTRIIVTKLLIELRRLANPETPIILGIAVVEDVFIAIYLAIVAVVIGGETDL